MVLDVVYAETLFRLSDSYRDTGNLNEALQCITDALQVYKALDNHLYYNCIERTAGIYYQLGNLPRALRLYQQYNQLRKQILKTAADNINATEEYAHSYQLLGNIYYALGNYDDAEYSYKRSKQILLPLKRNTGNSIQTVIETLAITYEKLGEVYYARGENRKALHAYKAERLLFEQLYALAPSIRNKYGLAIVYSKIGELKMYCGKHKQSRPFFFMFNKMMIAICHEYRFGTKYRLNLAWSYQFLGMFYVIEQKHERASRYFIRMVRQFEKLVHIDPQNVEYVNGLATSFAKLGETFFDIKQYENAAYYYQKRVKVMEGLCHMYPLHPEFNNNLSGSYSHLGEALLLIGNIDDAIDLHRSEIQLCKNLSKKFNENTEYRLNVAIAHCKMGNCYIMKGDYEQACKHFGLYRHHVETLIKKDPKNIDFMGNYAEALVVYAATAHLYKGTLNSKNLAAANNIWNKLYIQTRNRLYRKKITLLNKIISKEGNLAYLIVEMCSF